MQITIRVSGEAENGTWGPYFLVPRPQLVCREGCRVLPHLEWEKEGVAQVPRDARISHWLWGERPLTIAGLPRRPFLGVLSSLQG